MNSPVLLIGFNRPEKFIRVLDSIPRENKRRIYISLDGPRKNNVIDRAALAKILRYLKSDKNSNFFVHLNDTNLGCKVNVINSINWFFKSETAGIILEDDCLPHNDFFTYMDLMLQKYQSKNDIFTISGSNFRSNGKNLNYSVNQFSRFPNVWGWGTWSNRWNYFIKEFESYSAKELKEILQNSLSTKKAQKYFLNAFLAVRDDVIDTWDYNLSLTSFANKKINIHPNVDLIENIGFDAQATHTIRSPKWLNYSSASSSNDYLIYDQYIERYVYRNSIFNNIFIMRIVKMSIFQYIFRTLVGYLK